jgi:hypothetical protein
MNKNKARITIDVPEAFHRKLKILVSSQGTTIESGTKLQFNFSAQRGLSVVYENLDGDFVPVTETPMLVNDNGPLQSLSKLTKEEAYLLTKEGKWEC